MCALFFSACFEPVLVCMCILECCCLQLQLQLQSQDGGPTETIRSPELCNVVGFGAGSERVGVRRSVGLVVDAWCLAGDRGHGQ